MTAKSRPHHRPQSLTRRAPSHALWIAVTCLLTGASPSCSQDATEDEPEKLVVGGVERDASGIPLDRERAPVGDEARQEIANLIESLKPLDPTLTSNHHDRRFIKNQKWVKRLMRGDTEIGAAALHAFTGYPGEEYDVRRALLIVGGHAAPEAARPLLEKVMVTYGYYRVSDRTEAALVLAETSPEHYLELAEPLLRRRGRAEETGVPDEFLARGYAEACARTEHSPVDVLADVLTNLAMEDAARHFAAKELGRYPGDELGEAALRTTLVESTGNGYVRRMAAQALRDTMRGERGRVLFQEVAEREVDGHFRSFLEDLLNANYR
ncbi:MAG: hypothetical protein GY711_24655 [bacterium]|nr:hypothetical protein [bacterium]